MDAISLRFGGEKQASRFPNPIQIEEVQEHIPAASQLIPSATHPSLLEILDINGPSWGRPEEAHPMLTRSLGIRDRWILY